MEINGSLLFDPQFGLMSADKISLVSRSGCCVQLTCDLRFQRPAIQDKPSIRVTLTTSRIVATLDSLGLE